MAHQVEVGDKIYLHRARLEKVDSVEDHLLISAHGGDTGKMFTVPGWANLYFYGEHGKAISDPSVTGIINGDYQVLEVIYGGSKSHDYILSKFQGRHGNERETYESIQRAVDSNKSYLDQAQIAIGKGDHRHAKLFTKRNFVFRFDVMTIRNRWWSGEVTLSAALYMLEKTGHQYGNIHCSFCRYISGEGTVSAQRFGTGH